MKPQSIRGSVGCDDIDCNGGVEISALLLQRLETISSNLTYLYCYVLVSILFLFLVLK